MFKTISRLIFGGVEETPEDVKPGEAGEEGWHVVTHQEAGSAENQEALLVDNQLSIPSPCGNASANMEADCASDAEQTVQTSSSSSSTSAPAAPVAFSQPKTVSEVTQISCIQKAKAWADRHYVSRNAMQRQNRVRQGVQSHSFQLQQPGHRSLSH